MAVHNNTWHLTISIKHSAIKLVGCDRVNTLTMKWRKT